jgi:GNAT superfamily N-acetyltransferase
MPPRNRMRSQTRVRAATPSDLDAMVGLIESLFALEPDFEFDPARVRQGLVRLLSAEDAAAVWIAEREGRAVGMCSAQIVVSTAEGGVSAWVEDVVVQPGLRRLGIGSSLLAAVSAWAAHRGIGRLQLLADRDNAIALSFYQSRCWHPTRLICFRQRPGA